MSKNVEIISSFNSSIAIFYVIYIVSTVLAGLLINLDFLKN